METSLLFQVLWGSGLVVKQRLQNSPVSASGQSPSAHCSMIIGALSAFFAAINPIPNIKDNERANIAAAAAFLFEGALCHKKAGENSSSLFDINMRLY